MVSGIAMSRTPALAQFVSARSTPSTECTDQSVDTAGGVVCLYGAVNAEPTVMLIGDSHAAQWLDAMDSAAGEAGVRLAVRWSPGCPATGVNVISFEGVVRDDCGEFQANTRRAAAELHPDAILIGQASTYQDRILDDAGNVIVGQSQFSVWEEEYTGVLEELLKVTPTVGVIEDIPRLSFDPIECNTRVIPVGDCSPTVSDAFQLNAPMEAANRAAEARAGVEIVFSANDAICGDGACQTLEADGTPIYRDFNHVGIPWAASQVPTFVRLFESLASTGV